MFGNMLGIVAAGRKLFGKNLEKCEDVFRKSRPAKAKKAPTGGM
jgi:hypothetical protein